MKTVTKTLTYSGFTISFIFIVLAFITAKTYSQLAIATILYPILAYFALRSLPTRVIVTKPKRVNITPQTISIPPKIEVADIDKRTFLKLIGAAGASFFLFSLLGRRVESLLFGKSLQSGLSDSSDSGLSGVSPTDGYKIAEIDEDTITYYGFTNQTGGWMIMKEDTETSSFRYAKGGSNFSDNWSDRENLKYDYYYNLF